MSTREMWKTDDPAINISPVANPKATDGVRKILLDLQLRMATSSINHEYARMEFEDSDDIERRDELLEYMNECRREYFEARSGLCVHDPSALADFEVDLARQKIMTLGSQAAIN